MSQEQEEQSQLKGHFSKVFQATQAQVAKTNDAIVSIDPTSEKAADALSTAADEVDRLSTLVKSNDVVFKTLVSPTFAKNYKVFHEMATKCDEGYFTTFADPKDMGSLDTSYKTSIANLKKTIANNKQSLAKAKKEIKKSQKGVATAQKPVESTQEKAADESETETTEA